MEAEEGFFFLRGKDLSIFPCEYEWVGGGEGLVKVERLGSRVQMGE